MVWMLQAQGEAERREAERRKARQAKSEAAERIKHRQSQSQRPASPHFAYKALHDKDALHIKL